MTVLVPDGRGLGDADGRGASGVGRLVLISTAHLRWPLEERSVCRHAELLATLLDPARPGQGWFTCSDAATRRGAPEPATGRDDHDPWRWSPSGGNRLDAFVADLRRACLAGRAAGDEPLAAFRHRLFVDGERFRAVSGRRSAEFADLAFSVVFDFRFSTLGGTPVCHVSVSVWSHAPWSSHHRPDEVEGPVPMRGGDLLDRDVERAFLEVRADAVAVLDPAFTVANLRVFGRPYRAPLFWIAIPHGSAADPRDFLALPARGLQRAGQRLLGVPDTRDHGLARSVLGGDLLVMRRFAPDVDRRQDVPTYLVWPARTPHDEPHDHAPDHAHDAAREGGFALTAVRIARQEDAIRRTITALTTLEAEAAAHLWEIEATLEIADNHLHVYGNAVDRGARIWDALASRLPVERGRHLARVYSSVQLLQQTLNQVVSDVDRILAEVEATVVALDAQATSLQQRFAEEFCEAVVEGHGPISRSLSATGHFPTVRDRAGELSARATRIAATYRHLLAAIEGAFNERRVRENDVLHRAGAVLAAGLAAVGLMTLVGSVFAIDPIPLPEGVRPWMWVAKGLAAAVLLYVVLGWASVYSAMGRLGSVRYRFVYRRLLRFLRLTSSSRLDHLSARIEQATADDGGPGRPPGLADASRAAEAVDRRRTEAWRAHDDQLAREFAHLWDLIDLLPGDERVVESAASALRPADDEVRGWWTRRRVHRRRALADRRQLQRMVEKWSLRTLLLAERPREMYRYHLVRLTLLYRAALPLLGRERHVLSRTDLRFVLQRWPRHAMRTDEVERVLHWIDREADAVFRDFAALPEPDAVQPPDAGAVVHLLSSVRHAAAIVRRDHARPDDGRAATLLRSIERVGLRTGFGGWLHDGCRDGDGRRVVLRRIGRRLENLSTGGARRGA